MNILGFDTGLNKTYLALCKNDKIISKTIKSHDGKYHSAFLLQEIVNILKENGLKPQDIDLITTNIGPGSFTGIRVGLTVARTFAQGINAKTIGVNSLKLISKTYKLPAITILDARKNKAYVGNNDNVELQDLDKIPEILSDFQGKIIADTKMCEFLKENNITATNFENEEKDYGTILINIAKEKLSEDETTTWQNLKPLYIQPPPIHQKNN